MNLRAYSNNPQLIAQADKTESGIELMAVCEKVKAECLDKVRKGEVSNEVRKDFRYFLGMEEAMNMVTGMPSDARKLVQSRQTEVDGDKEIE